MTREHSTMQTREGGLSLGQVNVVPLETVPQPAANCECMQNCVWGRLMSVTACRVVQLHMYETVL